MGMSRWENHGRMSVQVCANEHERGTKRLTETTYRKQDNFVLCKYENCWRFLKAGTPFMPINWCKEYIACTEYQSEPKKEWIRFDCATNDDDFRAKKLGDEVARNCRKSRKGKGYEDRTNYRKKRDALTPKRACISTRGWFSILLSHCIRRDERAVARLGNLVVRKL